MKKPITLTDLNLLKKVLGLLGSTQDGEVVNAARKAMKILKDNDLTWADIFDRTVTVAAPTFAPATYKKVHEPVWSGECEEEETESDLVVMIEKSFDELRGVHLGAFRDFVDKMEKEFVEKRYLTPGQRAPIFNAVKRFREKRA